MEERGSNLEIISTKVTKYNASYVEISQWLERAENFQLEQKNIDESLKVMRSQIKEQKVTVF